MFRKRSFIKVKVTAVTGNKEEFIFYYLDYKAKYVGL